MRSCFVRLMMMILVCVSGLFCRSIVLSSSRRLATISTIQHQSPVSTIHERLSGGTTTDEAAASIADTFRPHERQQHQ